MSYRSRPGSGLRSHVIESSIYDDESYESSWGSDSERHIKREGKHTIDPDDLLDRLRAAKPSGCTGAYDFKWEYLFSELLSKLPRPGVPACERAQRAVDKALEADAICDRINSYGYDHSVIVKRDLECVFHYARSWIADVLGPVDYSMFEFSKHGSGATTSRRRDRADAVFKYVGKEGTVDVTSRARRYAESIIALTPLWNESRPAIRVVSGNRIFTVPKKTDIDRACAAEPDMNMYLQLSVGRYIRTALRRVGIDLRKQEINQQLAKLGSTTGELATIDLKSASDCISMRLVWDLLPPQWSDLLDDLRSPFGEIGGRLHRWAKISSMGNGFTFELESLIFASLLVGASRHFRNEHVHFGIKGKNAVYGDDIICHVYTAPYLIEVLSAVGFTTNSDKTFIRGPFRESCGKHYYSGHDVSPFYIRKPVDNLVRVIWLANAIRRWASDDQIVDPSVWDIWLSLQRLVPKRFRGSRGQMGDTALISAAYPHSRLAPAFKFRTRVGAPGVLTWFQGTMVGEAQMLYACLSTQHEAFAVLNDRLVALVKTDDGRLTPDIPDQMLELDPDEARRYKATRTSVRLIVKPAWFRCLPNHEPCRSVPLFPQELGL